MFKQILLLFWQLPQFLVGCLMLAILKPGKEYSRAKATFYYTFRIPGGISFGPVIFLNQVHYRPTRSESLDKYIARHEYGHSRQSRILGWFYLPLIGLPSIIWAGIHSAFFPKADYYKFFTESWANKLGGNS